MAVLLIFEEDERPTEERIVVAVLPSRKVLTKNEGVTASYQKWFNEFPEDWQNSKEYRETVIKDSESFFERSVHELAVPTADSDEMPIGAFYWEIMRLHNNQAVGSAIFSDDEARDLLHKGGWFNDN
jgi:hypothetical protein